jgi:hypothetical protein
LSAYRAPLPRALAQAALGDKWQGKDPQADRRAAKVKPAQTTLAELIDLYLLDKKPDLKSITFYEAERYLRKAWRRCTVALLARSSCTWWRRFSTN